MLQFYPHVHGRGIFKFYPYVKKFRIPLLSKTLVSKIDLKEDPWAMELEERGTPSNILMF